MKLVPAYGRDYNSKAEVQADLEAGKDFMVADISSRWCGSYCSIRNFEVGDEISVRYKKLGLVVIFKVSAKGKVVYDS